jgi:beta-glucanase (GH16 family)
MSLELLSELTPQLIRGLRVLAPKLLAIQVLSVVALSFLSVGLNAQGTAAGGKQTGWKLVWSDEFDRPNGSAVDASKWVTEVGGEGWGNQELEYYTNRPQNIFIRDGNLVIRAWRESYTGADGVKRNYTSARLKSAGKFSQTYGRFEARIKIPAGQGMWPAFWMLGDDIEKVGWPACGEIDIMENIGKEPSMVHGSIHGPGFVGGDGIEAPYTLSAKRRFADDFHIFAVEWEPNAIRFYVDHDLYVTRTRADLHRGWKWVFDHPFFLVLNLAVGGDWPGNPDSGTVFPQKMLVDYVRVYQRASR